MLPYIRLIQLGVPRLDREPTALGHRVAGVHGEVDDHLLQLVCVGPHGSEGRVELRDHDNVLTQQPPQQLVHVGHEVVEVEHAQVQDLLAAEREELTREPSGSIGGLADLLEIGSQRGEGRKTIQQQGHIA